MIGRGTSSLGEVPPEASSNHPSHVMLGAMDREIMARALERAEQHVIDGDRLIAQQKELIANLSAVGLDASACCNTLVRLEQTQSLRVQYASKLRQDLLNASPTESSRGRRSGPYELSSAGLRITSL